MSLTIAYLLLSLTFATPSLEVSVGSLKTYGDPASGRGVAVSLIQGGVLRTLDSFSGGVRRVRVSRRTRRQATFRTVFSRTPDEATAFEDVTFRAPGSFSMDLTAGRTDGRVDTGKETYYLTLYADGRREVQLRVDLDYATGAIEVRR